MTAVLALSAALAHAMLLAAVALPFAALVEWFGGGCVGRPDRAVADGFREIRRLARKTSTTSERGSAIGRHAPPLGLAATAVAALLVPSFCLDTAFAPLSDLPTIAGLAAIGRVAWLLAAMDRGEAKLDRRAAERARIDAGIETIILPLLATVALGVGGCALDPIAGARFEPDLAPSAARGLAAGAAIALAVADIAGRAALAEALDGIDLAFARIAEALRLVFWCDLGLALVLPAGMAEAGDPAAWPTAIAVWAAKLAAIGVAAGTAAAVVGTVPARWAERGLAAAACMAALGAVLAVFRAAAG